MSTLFFSVLFYFCDLNDIKNDTCCFKFLCVYNHKTTFRIFNECEHVLWWAPIFFMCVCALWPPIWSVTRTKWVCVCDIVNYTHWKFFAYYVVWYFSLIKILCVSLIENCEFIAKKHVQEVCVCQRIEREKKNNDVFRTLCVYQSSHFSRTKKSIPKKFLT